MTRGKNSACSLTVNSSAIFVSGGNPTWNTAQILNPKTGEWTDLQNGLSPLAGGCELISIKGRLVSMSLLNKTEGFTLSNAFVISILQANTSDPLERKWDMLSSASQVHIVPEIPS